jgi:hypothetical protein
MAVIQKMSDMNPNSIDERCSVWAYRLGLWGISLAVFGSVVILYRAGLGSLYHSLLSAWGANLEFFVPIPYRPFIDIHEYLAALECQRLGWDVFVNNPCDALGRTHTYPVWLTPHLIALDTSDTGWLGASLAIAFISSVAWIANPQTLRECAIYLIAMLSPVSAYAIERANMDLLVFVSVVVAAFIFSRGGLGRITAYAVIFLMATLKFYPIAAMGLALNEKRWRLILVAAITGIVWIAFLYAVRHEISQMLANLPDLPPLGAVFGGFDSFAVVRESLSRHFPQWAKPIGLMIFFLYAAATLVAMVMSAFLSRGLLRVGVVVEGSDRNVALFIIGAFIVICIFFIGYNTLYREIFLLMLLPYAFDSSRKRNLFNAHRRFWVSAIAVVIALLWFECLRSSLAVRFGSAVGPAANLALFVREPLWWMFIIGLASLLFTWLQTIAPISFLRLSINRPVRRCSIGLDASKCETPHATKKAIATGTVSTPTGCC